MAMFESLGFCPSNSFVQYVQEHNDDLPTMWNRTRDLLGDRIGYMVYTPAGSNYTNCYVVECLIGATDTMGIEIACQLKHFIPKCKYSEIGKMILITDVINPFQIPGIALGYDNAGNQIFQSNNDDLHLFEDNRYVCGIIDCEDAVKMYIFKK